MSLFAVFAFGVGAAIGLSFMMNDDPEIVVPENIDVAVAEWCSDRCIDVEAGKMCADCQIPDKLPICVTEDYVDQNFILKVFSYGGYKPYDVGCDMLKLTQTKTGIVGWVKITWDQGVEFECPVTGCTGMLYTASFDICGGGPIVFESNHLPTICNCPGDDCWCWKVDGCPSPDLDKWVKASICTAWEGCHKEDQKFTLILAQKRCFQSPQLRVSISSPV